jgi:hypothetical protein
MHPSPRVSDLPETRHDDRATARGPQSAGNSPAAAAHLLSIAGGLVLSMATWFAASAAAPALRREWHLSALEATVLTSAVQVGFVLGALVSAALNLPDRVHPPRLAAGGSLSAAASTAALALFVTGAPTAVLLRLVTGISLALVYPVALKLAISWFSTRRGLAVGVLVGALTLGSNLPQLVSGATGDAWRQGLLVCSGLAVIAAFMFRRVTVGPHVDAATGLRPGAVFVLVRNRGPRLASLGYLGHMWELYALWVWLPAFAVAGLGEHGERMSAATVRLVCFVSLGVCGAAGCFIGGWFGDRVGHARTAAAAMLTSGTCCVLAAVSFGGPTLLVVPILMIWGGSAIADSAMFSVCLGSSVDRDLVGSALTLQTALGFLLTIVTIQTVPFAAAAWGWPPAIALLAIGPLLGAIAMIRAAR